jgi:8-oxo-dGTP diphosphatase
MIVVTAGIIEKHGKILIARRKQGDALEHKWEFPGGKIEPGEMPEQCLVRELMEEFGVQTQVNDLVCSSTFAYAHTSIQLLAYHVVHPSGQFLLHDHEEIRWVALDELGSYDFAEADIPIAQKLREKTNNAI